MPEHDPKEISGEIFETSYSDEALIKRVRGLWNQIYGQIDQIIDIDEGDVHKPLSVVPKHTETNNIDEELKQESNAVFFGEEWFEPNDSAAGSSFVKDRVSKINLKKAA